MAGRELPLLCQGLGGVGTSGEMSLSWETERLLSRGLVADNDLSLLSLELVGVLPSLKGSACAFNFGTGEELIP